MYYLPQKYLLYDKAERIRFDHSLHNCFHTAHYSVYLRSSFMYMRDLDPHSFNRYFFRAKRFFHSKISFTRSPTSNDSLSFYRESKMSLEHSDVFLRRYRAHNDLCQNL